MYIIFKVIYLLLVLLPILVVLILSLWQGLLVSFQKQFCLIISLLLLFLSVFLFLIYLHADCSMDFVSSSKGLIANYRFRASLFPMFSVFMFDFLSLNLILLTSFIFCLIIYYTNNTIFVKYNYCMIFVFSLWSILNLLFCVMNLLLFYFLFELSLLPMFFIIGIWGNRLRRTHAAVFFFMYTSILSFLFLIALLFIYYWLHTFDYLYIKHYLFSHIFEINQTQFQLFWLLSIVAFFAKLPIFPFHIWLPEAHVEAPTIGSVILASILLKVGAYAIIRFLLPFYLAWDISLFGKSFVKYLAVIKVLLWVSFLYSTLIVVSQVDLKKIIAYSSIIHMSLCMIGFFSKSIYGVYGGYLMLFAHGFSSAGLFFIAGMLYSRFGTRLLKYYSGVHLIAPKLSFFAFFFFLANIGFPGTINFISEFLILQGIVNSYSVIFILFFGLSFIVSILYSVWIYNKIFLGTFNSDVFEYYYDLNDYEYNILFTLMSATLVFGIFPNFIL